MKYLNFTNEEFKELINLKKGSFILYLVLFGVFIVASYFISDSILPENEDITAGTVVFLFALSYLFIFFYSNRSYFYDLVKKEKKVYKGVLSSKTAKERENKYQFNMDGNIFVVDKATFDQFNVGDIVEFHISAFTKHLFKVEKVAETF